ncbi:MAG TPA: ribonuclease D, partial [Collinsella sp.]|nr:ribonuclease D [Collinsella sp.]
MYISTHQALLDFCQRAREFDAIAVDTEFLRERTFHPRLCLVQIATPAESVAVDPLVIDDLSPLAELMADESVVKVFHACSQDMEVMLHTVGALPRPIFDTQVAAAFLGERQQISYGALVQTFCGVSLPKTESLTDWSRRPLSDKQIEYAIDDVKYLIVAYTEMMSRLRELGRVDWVLDELRPLADESHYRADRHEAFRKVKRINSCSRHQLGIARELAAWREDRAERRNIPRKWVMSDDTLLALVKRNPVRVEEFR